MRAIRTGKSLGQAELLEDVPIPSSLTALAQHPAYVLLKPSHVGINPCHYLSTDYEGIFAPGITLGCKYAGEVMKVGPRGMRHCIWRPWAGMNVALGTVLNAFYNMMGLPSPGVDVGPSGPISQGKVAETSERTILVYGRSTTTGLMAIQWAKLSGMLVITTCSAANFGLVKERGSDHAFDYHDTKDCVKGIRRVSVGHLRLVFDCVGAFDSPQICADAMAFNGEDCLYTNFLSPTPFPRKDVKSIFTPGQAVLGEAQHTVMQTFPGNEELLKAFKSFLRLAERLFRDGKIRPPPTEIVYGMEKILDVVDNLRKWNISGKKMVARI